MQNRVGSPNRFTAPPDAIHCAFCRRTHTLEPDDAETECRVNFYTVDYEGSTPSSIRPVCEDCFTSKNWPSHVTVRALSPIRQLAHIDDLVDDDLAGLLQAHAPDDEWRVAELHTAADRILRRLAEDDAEQATLTEAAEVEVALVRANLARQLQIVDRRRWWRENAVRAIAVRLLPDHVVAQRGAKKSVNLTYGTLARKDYRGAPALKDEAEALASVRSEGKFDKIKVTLSTTLGDITKRLADWVDDHFNRGASAATPDGEAEAQRTKLEQTIREFVDDLTEGEDSIGEQALAWGELKKELAGTGEAIEGVEYVAARTEYTVEVTRAK